MNISIFGLGYVGCVCLGCLAKNGHHVIGVDVNELKVNLINEGKTTIIEKDIDEIIKEQRKKNSISATIDHISAVLNSDVTVICVGTPSSANGHLNIKYVYRVSKQIGKGIKNKKGFHVVAIRSTVLPGINKRVGEIIAEESGKQINRDFAIVSNPEFMREGSAVKDFYNPPYVVIGTDNDKAFDIMKKVYKGINTNIERVEVEVAELIKLVNNSFHALKISFANEIGNICKKLKVDSHQLMNLFIKDKHLNISPYYLKPGFAFGGSCLPKDLKSMKTIAHDFHLKSHILESIEKSNENHKKVIFDMIVSKKKDYIGIIGLSFKKGTDDLRYSPAVELAEMLLGKGYNLKIYDEKVNLSNFSGTNKEYIYKHIPHLVDLMTDNLNELVKHSEVIVVTQYEERFKNLDEEYPEKIVIDLVKLKNKKSYANYEGICW